MRYVYSFLLTFSFLFIPIVANANLDDLKIDKFINFYSGDIQKAIADEKNNRIYVVVKKSKSLEEELIALDLEGNELWHYKPSRYLNYQLYLQDNGEIYVTNFYASRIYTDGYDIDGGQFVILDKNGEVKKINELNTWQHFNDVFIDESGIVLGHNRLNAYLINPILDEPQLIYSGTNTPQFQENIVATSVVNNNIRIYTSGSVGIKLIEFNIQGERLNESVFENVPTEDSEWHLNYKGFSNGTLLVNTMTAINSEGNIIDSKRHWKSNINHYISLNDYTVGYTLNRDSIYDDFYIFDSKDNSISKVSFNKLDSTSESKMHNLSRNYTIDNNKHLYIGQKNYLFIVKEDGVTYKKYKSSSISEINVASLLNSSQILLFDKSRLYIANLGSNSIENEIDSSGEMSIWDEKITNDKLKNWTISFSKKIDPTTVSMQNVFISFDSKGKYNTYSNIEIDSTGTKIILKPVLEWSERNDYYIFIKGIKSIDGESLKSDVSMKFKFKH